MTINPSYELFSKVSSAWMPEPDLPLSQWAEKHIYLPSGRLKLFPHQRAMLDAIGEYEETVLMTAARVGKTMLSSIVCSYFLSAKPLRVGFFQPTADDCNSFSAESLMPLLEGCEPVAKLFNTASRKTMTHIESSGGSLRLLSASTARSFRRIDLDLAVFDESSNYVSLEEGDIISLGKKRTMNSFARKIIQASTPTGKESLIVKAWNDSNQNFFWMPCLNCGAFQVLEWENMCIGDKPVINFSPKEIRELREDNPEFDVTYRCCHCGDHIEREKHLTLMLENGEFRPANPSSKIAGFALAATMSPFPNCAWNKLTDEYFLAKSDPLAMRTFLNTILGLPYEDSVSDIDVGSLMDRCVGRYSEDDLPKDCLALFMGVDVQGDRIEGVLIGLNDSNQYYMIAHKVFSGSPAEPDVWKLLDDYLDQPFNHELGGDLYITACAVDSGYLTTDVANYAGSRHNVFAIKGRAGPIKLMEISRQKLKEGDKLFNVGVDTGKDGLFLNLTQTDIEQPGFWYFPEHLKENEEFFNQLTSEHKIITVTAGRPIEKWVRKTGRVAEVLDATIYALAVASQFSPNFEEVRKELTVHPTDGPDTDPYGWGDIASKIGINN